MISESVDEGINGVAKSVVPSSVVIPGVGVVTRPLVVVSVTGIFTNSEDDTVGATVVANTLVIADAVSSLAENVGAMEESAVNNCVDDSSVTVGGTPPMEEAVVTASESLMAVWETDSKLMDEAGTCERESVVNKTASVAGVCVDGSADTTDVAVTSVLKTAVGVAINIDVAVDEGRALTVCDASVGSAVTVAMSNMPGVGMAADVVMIVDSVDDGARLTEDDSVRGVEGSVLNDAVDASTTNNDEEGATVKKSVVDASAAKAVVSVSVENTRVEPSAVVASAENDTEDASVENSVESSLVST